jgi:23S rRNA (uracil1939-C5)-methyltransferase
VGAELAGADGRVIAVERGASAVADARKNLADLPVTVVQRTIETWRPERASVVLADPSREGLGAKAVEALAATRAERFVLVSCDPAALGRDARLLGTLGYRAVRSTLVDLFPHTSHVEVVTRFDRSPT